MRDFLAKHTDFKGIVTAAVKAPINTFLSLINFRPDLKLGALVSRVGYRNAKTQGGLDFIPSFSVKGFTYNEFADLQSTVMVGSDRIITRPGIENDTITDEEINITQADVTEIKAVGSSSISVLASLPLIDRALYTIVRNVSLIPHEFAVVKSIGATSGFPATTVLNLSRVISGWSTGDTVVFYQSELQASVNDLNYGDGLTLPLTVDTRVQFLNVGGKNDIGIIGVSESLFDTSMWTGRIVNRNYFGGNGFSFNGIYATALMDDFTRGAFQSTKQHIQVKTTNPPPAVQQRQDPNSDVTVTGWTRVPAGPNIWDALNDGDTPNDTTYATATAPGAFLEIGLSTMLGVIDPNGVIQLNIRCSGSLAGSHIQVSLHVGTGSIIVFEALLTNSFKTFTVSQRVKNINYPADFGDVKLLISFYSGTVGTPSTFQISWVALYIPVSSYLPIVVKSNSVFMVSFSFVEDGFNETRLIYEKPYGFISTAPAAYVDSNALLLRTTDNNNIITAKISTDKAELVNRRGTALRIYGAVSSSPVGTLLGDNLLWRFCKEVPLDNANWVYSAGTYSIEVNIGDEINSGELYVDRTGQAVNDNLVKKVFYGASLAGRTFVRNDTDKQTVYFSPITNENGFSQSSLPSSNFFLLSRVQGDIVGLASINNKLIAWKKFSTWVVDIGGFPTTVADNYLSREIGLASLASIAIGNRILYFVSYDGVYETDGFKVVLINQDWIEDFRSYSQSAIEASVGFYEQYSDSYYLYINNILWALDSKTQEWRQESLIHTPNRGIVGYNSKDFNNRTIILGVGDGELYEFPRLDNLYKDTVDATDFAVNATFQTNVYRSDIGEDEYAYINNGYLIGENLGSANITINDEDGSIIRSSNITSRSIFQVRSMKPLTDYSIIGTFSTETNKIVIREIGFYMKAMRRAGSVLK